MNRTLVLLTTASLLFASCQDDPKADQAQTGEAMTASAATGATYKADLGQSRVEWIGTKPVGEHHGVMNLKDGSVTVEGGSISGGRFDVDMHSMKITDEDTNGTSKLAIHLRGGDFFEVEKYPTATFEITSVKAGIDPSIAKDLVMKDATHTVSGNFTLKGQTKGITFPARISIGDASLTADANFNIDRTQWGLVYGNKESLGDSFIRPTVNISFHLVANK